MRPRARGLVAVLSGATVALAGACGGSTERDEEILMAWLACDECTEGELQRVVDSLGARALPALRETLSEPLDEALDNAEAVARADYRRTPRQSADTAAFVAAIRANLEALYHRRAILGLAALGDTATLREAFDQRIARSYRDDTIALLEHTLGEAGAPGFQPPSVASLTVRPDTTSAAAGDSVVFEAVARDAGGLLLASPLTWTVAGTGATVTSPVPARGIVRLSGAAAGTVVVRATAPSGASGSGSIFVRPPPAPVGTLVIISGDGQAGPAGTTAPAPLVVELRNAQGQLLSGVDVTWTIERPGVALQGATTATAVSGRSSLTVAYGAQPGRVVVVASAPGAPPVRFQLRARTP